MSDRPPDESAAAARAGLPSWRPYPFEIAARASLAAGGAPQDPGAGG